MANAANPPAQGPAPNPSRESAAKTDEVTALLLQVLRNVNREVETTLEAENRAASTRELEGNAQKAVVHFREISRDLRTPADGSASFGNSAAGTTAATGTAGAPGSTGSTGTTGSAAQQARPR
jgi:hypothetical protein